MTIQLESLLLAIAFIVPGFLTSKLIESRTPARTIEVSTFEDTAESILRSVYINLVVAMLVLAAHIFFPQFFFPEYASYVAEFGFVSFVQAHQLPAFAAAVVWLLLAFAIAVLFGAVVDPLHSLMLHLSKSQGTLSVDSFSVLRQNAVQRRKDTAMPSRLWLRVRMTSGAIYRGEILSASYRHPDLGREILLANATYVAPPDEGASQGRTTKLDFVVLNLSDSDAAEVLFDDQDLASA